ncbi:hypothetical protein HY605_05850 [Candidatus Peregrinibacteria bacterium]|nr:hypothetical protein [Candidatus Peregrinibacteria bacterium]
MDGKGSAEQINQPDLGYAAASPRRVISAVGYMIKAKLLQNYKCKME